MKCYLYEENCLLQMRGHYLYAMGCFMIEKVRICIQIKKGFGWIVGYLYKIKGLSVARTIQI